MSDIPLTPRQTLTQALNTLQSAGSTSPLAQKAADVLVAHIAGNQLTLSTSKGQRSVPVNNEVTANLRGGQTLQARLVTQATGSLLELFASSSGDSKSVALEQSVLQQLVRRPEIFRDLSTAKPLLATATVLKADARTATLSVAIGNTKTSVSVAVGPDTPPLKVGQAVQVQLVPIGQQWHVRLVNASTAQPNSALSSQNAVAISPQQALPLLLSSISQRHTGDGIVLQRQTLMTALPPALQSLVTQRADTALNLTVNKAGVAHLVSQASNTLPTQPLSQTPLTSEVSNALKALGIPELADTSKSAAASAQMTAQTPGSTQAQGQNPLNAAAETRSPAQVKEAVQQLLRVLIPDSVQSAEILRRVESAFAEPSAEHNKHARPLVDALRALTGQLAVQGNDADVAKLQQLFALPAQAVSASQLVTPAPPQGMLGALITLLQVSLSARLARSRPETTQRLSEVLTSLIDKAPSAPALTPRALQDFSALEQRHQLLREIGRLLGQHQISKLVNAEQQLQGQDSFYFTLPAMAGSEKRDIELLIRRQQDTSGGKKAGKRGQKIWHLTMKFDLDGTSELLTKARLRDDHLDLDLYTSDEATKTKVLEFLPWLRKRLQALGIEMGLCQCALGRIPDTLRERPYQIFETKA